MATSRDEWDELLGCGLDAIAAAGGDPVALAGCLNCAVRQTLGLDFFDLLGVLKAGGYLGQSWYDDGISYLQRAPGFPQVAQAIDDFANTIDDLNLLEDVAQLNVGDFNVPQLLSGNSSKVAKQRSPL